MESFVRIKVEKFLMPQGIRVGKAAVEFCGEAFGPLNRFHLVGFTICDDGKKEKYVMWPMAKSDRFNGAPKREGVPERNYYFLRPETNEQLFDLQTAILDVYDSLCESEFRNTPRIVKPVEIKV